MLIVRCANGVVAWLKRRVDAETFEWVCVNDQVAIASSSSADQSWVTVLQQLAAHSVALRGVIADVVWIPAGSS